MVPASETKSSEAAGEVPSTAPVYAEYTQRGIDIRHGAILFFAKPGDVFSEANDKLLRSLYDAGDVTVSTYRLDFSSATGSRLRYGVIVEDTFVLLDATGERVNAFIHPTPDEVRILVRGKVPASFPSQP